MRFVRILLIIVAVVCFGVALSYPIRYRQAQEDNDSNMEQLADIRQRAREGREDIPELPSMTYVEDETLADIPDEEEDEAPETVGEATSTGNGVDTSEAAGDASETVVDTASTENGAETSGTTGDSASTGNEAVTSDTSGDATSTENEVEASGTTGETVSAGNGDEASVTAGDAAPDASQVDRPGSEGEPTPEPAPTPVPTPTPEPTLEPNYWDLGPYMAPTPSPTPRPTRKPTQGPTPLPSPTPDRSIRTGPLPYEMKEKVTLDESAILPELREIYELNHDLVGWITIPDTVIDYPVVQNDDPEFYLSHDFYGEENINGQIILDPLCDPYTPSYNLIISGHHMKNGSMFGNLPEYRNKNYWGKHPFLEFDTLMERKQYVIFAAFYSADYDEDEEGFRYNANLEYKMDVDLWLSEVKENQLYDTEIDVAFGDEFITLTTCNRARHRNGRFVVVCRKIREGETFE